jgi:hypothetical protein
MVAVAVVASVAIVLWEARRSEAMGRAVSPRLRVEVG